MKSPQRIASLISSATEMLFLVGAGDRVVAVSHECDFPTRIGSLPKTTRSNIDDRLSSGEIDNDVKQRLARGEPLYEIDRSLITRLAPDLIITQAQCDVCAVRYADVVDFVRAEPSLNSASVVDLNPQSLDEILADIVRVAIAAGCEEQGRQARDELAARVEAVRAATAGCPPVKVACIEWIEPLMLAANWMPEVIRIAGGDDALSRPGHSGYSSWADVVSYDPDVIVVMPCGFGLERAVVESAALAGLDRWSEVSAVRSNRVFAVDGNAYFNRSGPRIVDSVEILARLLHPAAFADGPPAGAARPVLFGGA